MKKILLLTFLLIFSLIKLSVANCVRVIAIMVLELGKIKILNILDNLKGF